MNTLKFNVEIDGIQRALEHPCTEAGDYISDEYFKIIDLSTAPNQQEKKVREGIASAVRRLNRNLDATTVYLERAGLIPVYNNVIGQLNHINASTEGVGELRPIEPDNTSYRDYSASFLFADPVTHLDK